MMAERAAIIYNGFWDRPLGFVVHHRGVQFYFTREFDELQGEYEDTYQVFRLPDLSVVEIHESWGHLRERGARFIGHIPVSDIDFDPSFRAHIGTRILDILLGSKG